MNYQVTLDYMMNQLPMYHRVGAAAFKKDLTNTLRLCEHLGNPHTKFRSIHVGGTNGKGSTSHILAAILQSAGYKVGLYTSPHYKDFRERIKVNGAFISKKAVINFVEKNKSVFEEIQPSFFEMTVALAFDYFAQQKVDVAIIEVGLGGRLDSTNIISPDLSIITNISFDHVAMLGDTLPLIAFEKAGIIKKNTPIVIGETDAETAPVFIKKASEENASIVFADKNYKAKSENGIFDIFKNEKLILEKLETTLLGEYQLKNVATVFQSIEELQRIGYNIQEKDIRTAFLHLNSMVKFMGRWQKLQEKPLIIADSGHNEAGIISAVNQLKNLDYNNLYIVTGFVNDKDVSKVLSLFPKDATYFFAKANIPRGLDATELAAQAVTFGLKGKAYSSIKNAFRAAKKQTSEKDLLLVLGSIFVVAEVL